MSTCEWSRTRWLAAPLKAPSSSACTDSLKGPLLLAFSQEDPGSAARLIKDFAKDNDLKPVLASIGGKTLRRSLISTWRHLPTRDEARRQLMAVMKAPVESWCAPSMSLPAQLVRVLAPRTRPERSCD